ncbi:MAG: hypothetical protein IJM81_02455 [Prevotella sp.]|nr:hypothetical protein [Prevotella sp.]
MKAIILGISSLRGIMAGLLVCLLFISCATKQSAVNRLERFSMELRDDSPTYTLTEWKQAATQFVELRKQIAKHHYTPEERKRIGQLEGRCLRYMVEGAKDGVLNGILGLGNEVNGILEELLKLKEEGIELKDLGL